MLPRSGRQQAGEHFDGGGFSGAVGAQESEELAGSDAEIYVLTATKAAEAAREMFGGNRRAGDRGRKLHGISDSAHHLEALRI